MTPSRLSRSECVTVGQMLRHSDASYHALPASIGCIVLLDRPRDHRSPFPPSMMPSSRERTALGSNAVNPNMKCLPFIYLYICILGISLHDSSKGRDSQGQPGQQVEGHLESVEGDEGSISQGQGEGVQSLWYTGIPLAEVSQHCTVCQHAPRNIQGLLAGAVLFLGSHLSSQDVKTKSEASSRAGSEDFGSHLGEARLKSGFMDQKRGTLPHLLQATTGPRVTRINQLPPCPVHQHQPPSIPRFMDRGENVCDI